MLNLISDDMRRNPYPIYQQLRSLSPVLNDAQTDLCMLFDYESVKRALSDHETFSSMVNPKTGKAPGWLVFSDPPRHTKLRSIIMKAFTPRSIANLEPRIEEFSRQLLNETIEKGEIDIVLDYSGPLPTLVIAEMIGIPLSDRPKFIKWSEKIVNLSYAISGDEQAQQMIKEHAVVKEEMRVYLQDLLEERRRSPKEDLLTRLVVAEVDGEKLTEVEILGFFQLLLSAGTETTTNVISNGLLSFIEHPDQLAKLKAQPQLLPLAIEEIVRYRSPGQMMFRETRHEVELHGQTIPAGKLVLAMVGSANHDTKQFPDAERFDITRNPNPHIAFGHGPHFCLGVALARLEAKVAFSHILERLNAL